MKEQEQIQRQKRLEKRNNYRQKYQQELQAAEERKRMEKTIPCPFYLKHGRCDFVSFVTYFRQDNLIIVFLQK